ncbi:NAD(P)/FAD-dependent oxidoreductase [Actinomadura sediminis]|uniref:NAD(P)/FAD-dependent oxidoreductase n=1 Tax=Actinomadura sediminis TaxID=1038904 RepID=A0ABW3EW46_9ACTN
MPARPRVAVVGASLAGLRAAERLRAAGHDGPITVFGAEPHPPYNRPPLTKEALADPRATEPSALAERLSFRHRAATADVEFRLGDAVASADLAAGTLTTESGHRAGYDGLVAATGLRPRRLAVPGPAAGRHVLRTVEDCHGLRTALRRHGRAEVVVIGAGFIGCEAAATLRTLGHAVTVVEPAGPPLVRVIGEPLAAAVRRHHEAAGVRFVLGAGVTAFAGDGRVAGVVLGGGEVLPADVVVEAVGSACNTEWLAGNGLPLDDGVLTDNRLGIAGAPRAVAAGDVARFPNPLFDEVPRRVEHWSIPADTAKRAAATLVALLAGEPPDTTPFAPLPSFWSDQLGLRFQSLGSPSLADEVRVEEGDPDHLAGGVLATYHRSGRLVGALTVNIGPARQRDLRDAFAALAPTA